MKITPLQKYIQDIVIRVGAYKDNKPLQTASKAFFDQIGIGKADYVYNFTWLGVPIIQIPQDLLAMQEIIWQVKPDLIIETGIAWGGTLLHSASMLAVLEACHVIENGHVLGIDIDIRTHNKIAMAEHPLSYKITMLEGSSIDQSIIDKVVFFSKNYKKILVCLDSNHTHDHVFNELIAYAPLVSIGSYCIVGDTIIEDAPEQMCSLRAWGKGNNPKTAVWSYLEYLENANNQMADDKKLYFEIDKLIETKIVLTGSPDGYLKRLQSPN